MFNYFLQAGLFIGLTAVIYIFIKAAPRVSDLPQDKKEHFHWFKRLPLDKLDNLVSCFLEKWLRRIRVFLMKVDSAIIRQINKVKNNKQVTEKKEEFFKSSLTENNKTEEGDKKEKNFK